MKKKVIIAALLTIIVCVVIGSIIYLNSNQYKEKDLEKSLESIGKSYYEDYYYPTIGVDKIKTSKSIVITLDTIKNTNTYRDNDDLKKLDNCDKDNTYVKVTPIDPFRNVDYKVEIILDCEKK